jgi:hypothetical protein
MSDRGELRAEQGVEEETCGMNLGALLACLVRWATKEACVDRLSQTESQKSGTAQQGADVTEQGSRLRRQWQGDKKRQRNIGEGQGRLGRGMRGDQTRRKKRGFRPGITE